MYDDKELPQSNKIFKQIFQADSGWKIVFYIDQRYYIEDILAYAMIQSGLYYELIPLTAHDLYLGQTLHNYTLKESHIGLINPQNELIIVDDLIEEPTTINLQEIKNALKKNRFSLD